jgi:hypothetical protein
MQGTQAIERAPRPVQATLSLASAHELRRVLQLLRGQERPEREKPGVLRVMTTPTQGHDIPGVFAGSGPHTTAGDDVGWVELPGGVTAPASALIGALAACGGP